MAVPRRFIGQILVQMGTISPEELESALAEQKNCRHKLGTLLIQRGLLSEPQLLEAIALQTGVPFVLVDQTNIEPDVVNIIPPDFIHKHGVLPIERQNGDLILAMLQPFDHQVIEDVQMATGLNVIPVLAGEEALELSIQNYLPAGIDSEVKKILQQLNRDVKNARNDGPPITIAYDDAPLIHLIDTVLRQAVRDKASDIHIEPQEMKTRVRFRIDGILNTVFSIPGAHHPALVSRLKIMGGMDISEKRTPQDGRFSFGVDGRQVDFRVSSLPLAGGEKVALRILDRSSTLSSIAELGLSAYNQEKLLQLTQRPHGMVLLTGPTGSGKTTTLYAMLNEANSTQRNIITLEDPIEYWLEGINQMQTNPRAGLTFASGLRACFRQDPDIIMVGEIRDKETADLAVRASLTGHLLFSTLHTSSAVGAIARLIDMGVELYLLGSCLAGAIAQRLVRRLCKHCREPYTLHYSTAESLGIPQFAGKDFYRPAGCRACQHQGYRGRLAVHEVLVISGELRGLINRSGCEESILVQQARTEGFIDIKEDGIVKAHKGLTSLEEIMKAVLIQD